MTRGALLRAELGHFVVGTAHLEREDRLEVLALQQHPIAGARESDGASSSGVSTAMS